MGNLIKDRRHAKGALLVTVLVVLAVLVVAGPAMAFGSYSHGPTTIACDTCHPSGTATAPTVAACTQCHTGFAVPESGFTCQTCHAPGDAAVQAVKTGAPAACTAECHLHLPSGATHTHNPHPQNGTCTNCHNVTVSATNANGSPHHKAETVTPATTTLAAKVAPTVAKLGKKVKVSGTAGPAASLAGAKVAFKVERKVGTKWVKMKTASATASATGAYSWSYKTAKKGAHRVTVSIAATAKFTAKKVVKTFKVK